MPASIGVELRCCKVGCSLRRLKLVLTAFRAGSALTPFRRPRSHAGLYKCWSGSALTSGTQRRASTLKSRQWASAPLECVRTRLHPTATHAAATHRGGSNPVH